MAVSDTTTMHNGRHQAAPATLPVTNPVTGEIIGEVEIASREQVEAAARRAKTARRIWRAMSTAERCKILARFADLLWANRQEAMRINRRETGKTDTGAFIEVIYLINTAQWLAHHAPDLLAPERRSPAFPLIQYAKVYHKPWGTVGFITPWNYPLMLAFVDALSALAAGNAVILKPSEITPYSAFFAMKLLHQAGVPEDIVQIVTGDASTGNALIDNVDFIHFTGSTEVGRKIAIRAAERLIPCGLELGGKDALVVLRDANLDLAATDALKVGVENAGQTCISIERVYVDAPVYEEFIEKVQHYAQGLVIGSGDGFKVHVGSVTREHELLHTEKLVADALAKGARLLYGGKRRPDLGPLFYEPAILADVTPAMDLMQEEAFGPVVPIMRVANEAEAVEQVNSSRYGLSASVYTRDLALGEHLATQLQTGDATVNRAGSVSAAPALPWGGAKDSGYGRRNGKEGLLQFTMSQSVQVDTMLASRPTLDLIDDTLLQILNVLRILRKYLPFV